ncbi:MAG: response regulator [Candidatus Omnitrophica bacterium]|nr:response regulator [Candidatus Omnitrophota bacterium]
MNRTAESRLEVLVIDDEPSIREIMIGNLNERFPAFTFRQAESGNTALTLINERVPDLILIDLRMPGLNGFTLIRLLRNRDRTRVIPIIAVSALNDRVSVQKALEAGANDYCLKPIDFEQLGRKILRICSQYLRREDLKVRHRNSPRRRIVGATAAVMPVYYPEKEGVWVSSPMPLSEGDPLLFNGHQFFRALRIEPEDPYLWSRVEFCRPEDDSYRLKLLFDNPPQEYVEQLEVLNKSRQRFRRFFGGGNEPIHLEFPCEIRDLSGEGLRLTGHLPFEVGSRVHLDLKEILNQINLPAWNTKIDARIQWSESQDGQKVAGVRFLDMEEDLRQELMVWCLRNQTNPFARATW